MIQEFHTVLKLKYSVIHGTTDDGSPNNAFLHFDAVNSHLSSRMKADGRSIYFSDVRLVRLHLAYCTISME